MSLKDSQTDILKIAILFEGILASIYLISQGYSGLPVIPNHPSLREVTFALLLSQLLFIFNQVLVRLSFKNNWKLFTEFIREMILPIASKLDIKSSLMISLAAGIGEELFFRGFLQVKFGIVFASVSFGLVHFLFDLRKYFPIVILYIFIGFIFGLTFEFFDGLWVPVIFHCFYDFTALLYFKNEFEKGRIF